MATNADLNTGLKATVYLQDMVEVKKVNRFDTNSDGMISSTELVDVMKALGSDTSKAEVKPTMDEIDIDRDDFINLDEFVDFCKANGSMVGDDISGLQDLKDAFKMYDQDKNGNLVMPFPFQVEMILQAMEYETATTKLF